VIIDLTYFQGGNMDAETKRYIDEKIKRLEDKIKKLKGGK
jgi:hypothetical protein